MASLDRSSAGTETRPRRPRFSACALLLVLAPGWVSSLSCRASRAETEVQQVTALARRPTLRNLARIRQIYAEAGPEARAIALRVLVSEGASQADAMARSALDDRSAVVRAAAAAAAIDLRDVQAGPALARLASEDTDWEVRCQALAALVVIDGDEAPGALARALTDPVGPVRQAAIRAVESFPTRHLLHPLAAAVSGDPLWQVRRGAAEALGRSGLGEAYAPLAEALLDENEFVRSAATRAIRSLESAGIPRPIEDPAQGAAAERTRAPEGTGRATVPGPAASP